MNLRKDHYRNVEGCCWSPLGHVHAFHFNFSNCARIVDLETFYRQDILRTALVALPCISGSMLNTFHTNECRVVGNMK